MQMEDKLADALTLPLTLGIKYVYCARVGGRSLIPPAAFAFEKSQRKPPKVCGTSKG